MVTSWLGDAITANYNPFIAGAKKRGRKFPSPLSILANQGIKWVFLRKRMLRKKCIKIAKWCSWEWRYLRAVKRSGKHQSYNDVFVSPTKGISQLRQQQTTLPKTRGCICLNLLGNVCKINAFPISIFFQSITVSTPSAACVLLPYCPRRSHWLISVKAGGKYFFLTWNGADREKWKCTHRMPIGLIVAATITWNKKKMKVIQCNQILSK